MPPCAARSASPSWIVVNHMGVHCFCLNELFSSRTVCAHTVGQRLWRVRNINVIEYLHECSVPENNSQPTLPSASKWLAGALVALNTGFELDPGGSQIGRSALHVGAGLFEVRMSQDVRDGLDAHAPLNGVGSVAVAEVMEVDAAVSRRGDQAGPLL